MSTIDGSFKRLQSPLSNVCGQYCVAYVLLRCNGLPMRTFINVFGTDLVANDCRVFYWLKQMRQGRLYYHTSYMADGQHPQVTSSSPSSLWRGGDTPKLATSGVMVNIRKSPHLHRHSCRDITRYPYCIAMLLLLVQ